MKKNLDAIIKKGIKGAELGKICLDELANTYVGKERIFTEEDIKTLMNNITDPAQRRIYNSYRVIINFIHKELMPLATVSLLRTEIDIINLTGHLRGHSIVEEAKEYTRTFEIMTDKQYNEAKEIQKKERLSKDYSLSFVMLCIAEDYIRNRRDKIADLWDQYEKESKEVEKGYEAGTDLLERLLEVYISKEYYKEHLKSKGNYITRTDYGIEGFKEDFPEFFNLILNDIKKLVSSKKLDIKENLTKLPLKQYKDIKIKGNILEKLDIKFITEKIIDVYIPEPPEPPYDDKTVLIAKNTPSYNLDEKGYYKEDPNFSLEGYLSDHNSIMFTNKFFNKPRVKQGLQHTYNRIKNNLILFFIAKKTIDLLLDKLNHKSDVFLKSDIEDLENSLFWFNNLCDKDLLDIELENKTGKKPFPVELKPINLADYENSPTKNVKLITEYINEASLTLLDIDKIINYITEEIQRNWIKNNE